MCIALDRLPEQAERPEGGVLPKRVQIGERPQVPALGACVRRLSVPPAATRLACGHLRGPAVAEGRVASRPSFHGLPSIVDASARVEKKSAGCVEACCRGPRPRPPRGPPDPIEAAQRSPAEPARGQGSGPLPLRSPGEVKARQRSPARRRALAVAEGRVGYARLLRQEDAVDRRHPQAEMRV
jgi:hypothetical protein